MLLTDSMMQLLRKVFSAKVDFILASASSYFLRQPSRSAAAFCTSICDSANAICVAISSCLQRFKSDSITRNLDSCSLIFS